MREARARQRRRRIVAAAIVALVVGVGVAVDSLLASRAHRASGSGGPIAGDAPECHASQLAISFVGKGAVMGQEGGLLRFTNTGETSCHISGWPRVTAVTGNGREVRASRSLQSMLYATFWLHIPAVPELTLRYGVSGYAVLGGGDNPVGRSPTWPCPAARRLLVSPPGSRGSTLLSGFLWRSPERVYLPMCGGRPWVEPIRPRPRLSQ
jgi:hypothetical protein